MFVARHTRRVSQHTRRGHHNIPASTRTGLEMAFTESPYGYRVCCYCGVCWESAVAHLVLWELCHSCVLHSPAGLLVLVEVVTDWSVTATGTECGQGLTVVHVLASDSHSPDDSL